MFQVVVLLSSSLLGLVSAQSTQPTPLPSPSPNNICLSIVNSALQTLNATFELQARASARPFDISILPSQCFYLKSPETTCQQFPTNLADMYSIMVWITQLLQQCGVPGSWLSYPRIFNINEGVRQSFSTSLGTSGSVVPSGSMGVSGSVGSNGLGGSIGVGSNGYGGYGQGSAMMNAGASGTPVMMVPVQAAASVSATPANPFSTMMSIIGSSVGPQGVTISPATIAGILQLINQVVGIAVQLAPVGGAIAGPLLGAALG